MSDMSIVMLGYLVAAAARWIALAVALAVIAYAVLA